MNPDWRWRRFWKKISDVPGTFRIRLSSVDPVHLTDDLLAVLADQERVLSLLHVSIPERKYFDTETHETPL